MRRVPVRSLTDGHGHMSLENETALCVPEMNVHNVQGVLAELNQLAIRSSAQHRQDEVWLLVWSSLASVI